MLATLAPSVSATLVCACAPGGKGANRMTEPRKNYKPYEFWIVTVLLILFLGVAFYSEQAGQTVVEHASVSTYNARPSGTKALYELFGTVPYKVQRLAGPWTSLNAQTGLLSWSRNLTRNDCPP